MPDVEGALAAELHAQGLAVVPYERRVARGEAGKVEAAEEVETRDGRA